jgi:UDP-glucose 4,6-dehydratase
MSLQVIRLIQPQILPDDSFVESCFLRSPTPLPTTQFVKGDITSPDLINYLLKSENIDTIMHFAAQVHASPSSPNKNYVLTRTSPHYQIPKTRLLTHMGSFTLISSKYASSSGGPLTAVFSATCAYPSLFDRPTWTTPSATASSLR